MIFWELKKKSILHITSPHYLPKNEEFSSLHISWLRYLLK